MHTLLQERLGNEVSWAVICPTTILLLSKKESTDFDGEIAVLPHISKPYGQVLPFFEL